ncbi:YciE/YciF family protein [Polymorphobacter multimanifer]|uniref:Ferritin-like metal-binding protein YciE n=2 Tax=Polymorphobacter multimanifer TaxID=1070431 RepID=A0A841LEG1_9SPHN|nr:ferritin-like domain-containing protein [Polymorphobacter multimanifer]MBB6229433.1 ferritin-like metal-binding protein YciE [Polymorphobacter multimanifer]GGI90378.1 YciE/YciF family protein [Polymorphobacter multimanifer]
MRTLADLYYHMLQDVLHAEKQALKLLPKLARKVSNDELKTMLAHDREAIAARIGAVEEGFEALGKRAKTVPCEAMKGLVDEAEEVLEDADETALDAGVLAAVQAIKHYEITRFGTLSSWAMQTGQNAAQAQFQTCADACRKMDEDLTRLAEADVNVDADAAESENVDTKGGKAVTTKSKVKSSAKA